jgi:hypothetical protein
MPRQTVIAAVAASAAILLNAHAGSTRAQDLTEPGAEAGVVVQSPEAGEARPELQVDDSSRVRGLEHLGLRLGMPADDIERRFGVRADAVAGARAPQVVQHYSASVETDAGVKLTLLFDRDRRLYHAESVQVLKPGVSAPALRQRVESKYGPADIVGRMGLGTYRLGYVDPSAEMNVYADIAIAGREAPTLIRIELIDHARQTANQAAFRDEARSQGAEPAPQQPGDTRVKL